MLYTKKGDKGTTKLFNCPQGVRVSKSEPIFEALGTIDELNSMLGFTKILARETQNSLFVKKEKVSYENILENIQQALFFIQAELGGSPIYIKREHISYLEDVIFEIETILPPINSFIVYGGGKVGAFLDFTRAVARRAERLIITLGDKQGKSIHADTLQFLNRLSSALYALARYVNYAEGYTEGKPEYK